MEEKLEKNIANKVIIVTGGSRGIGAEIVKTLARESYTVILNYNKSEACAKNVESELKKEEHIVNILDRFDKLCNDISEGLPAEIEARRKQYEYYRDKLLNFKEINKNE